MRPLIWNRCFGIAARESARKSGVGQTKVECGASTGSDSAVEFSAFPKACRIMFLNFILPSCCIH
jgi:hypothetical protein